MFQDDECYRRGNGECQAGCVGGLQFAVLNRVPEEASQRRGPVEQGRELAVRLSRGKALGGGRGRYQGPEARPGWLGHRGGEEVREGRWGGAHAGHCVGSHRSL